MRAKKSIKEHEIVQYISEYMRTRIGRYQSTTTLPTLEQIEAFVKTKTLLDDESRKTLKAAIEVQHDALLMIYHPSKVGNYETGGYGLYPNHILIIPYGGGFHSGGVGGGGGVDGEGAIIVAIIAAVISAGLAAYGMGKDLYEISKEISNSQRVGANIATLAVTGALVYGATAIAIAVCATNPIGWGILASACLIMGVALLVKMTRAIVNAIDASQTEESGLTCDSRFQLTHKEELGLMKSGFTPEDIQTVKEIIRGLAVRAEGTKEMGFLGSKDDYLTIIKTLTDVKKGVISDDLRALYKITSGNTDPDPDAPQDFQPSI